MENNQSGVSSRPEYYAYYNDKIYFLYSPDASYTVTLNYKKSFTELSADSDTNNWTVYARQLLEHHALMLMYADVLMNKEQAATTAELVKLDVDSLRQRSEQLISSGEVVPSSW